MSGCVKIISGDVLQQHLSLVRYASMKAAVVTDPQRRLLWTLKGSGGGFRGSVSHPNGTRDAEEKGVYRGVRGYVSWMRTPFLLGTGRHKSNSNYGENGEGELGETTIMHQDGHEIQEVPVAVLKNPGGKNEDDKNAILYVKLDPQEEAAFAEAFSGYKTPQEVLRMLDMIPIEEVTPFVSLSVLKKLFELENNFWFRNVGKSWLISDRNTPVQTFARMAIVSRLMDTIITSEDPDLILETLDALHCDRISDKKAVESNPLATGSSMNTYTKRLLHEVLLRVTEGKFSVKQVTRAVVSLGKLEVERKQKIPRDVLDKLWIGIVNKSSEIDVNNIVDVFRTLQYFRKSRRLILNLAEKKTLSLWWKLEPRVVAEICSILDPKDQKSLLKGYELRVAKPTGITGKDSIRVSERLLLALSRCASLNIHLIKEDELLQVVRAFDALNFCDESIEKALVKYMKAKCLNISDPLLISAVLDYTKKFNIRSVTILDVASQHFIKDGKGSTSPPHMTSMVSAFGHLDFNPSDSKRFWRLLEKLVDEKFIQFPPKDMINLFLSCVYLQKYPVNFVDRIFSPYFLDRVHAYTKDLQLVQQIRADMKILDTALTIECSEKYNGPLLPRNFCGRSSKDGRILRMSDYIENVLQTILPKSVCILKSVALPELPLLSLYTAEFILFKFEQPDVVCSDEEKRNIFLDLVNKQTSGNLAAILINEPEHYLRTEETGRRRLIGSQQMRIRHFRTLGFNTVTLNYEKLTHIKAQPEQVEDYLQLCLNKVPFLAG